MPEDAAEAAEAAEDMARLVAMHRPQLEALPIPERHWVPMLQKMAAGRLDAGETFALTYEEDEDEEGGGEGGDDGRQGRRLKAVVVKDDGVKHEDPGAVWLVDHAWTFVCSQKPSRQLARHPPLLQRMAALVGLESAAQTSAAQEAEAAAVLRELWRFANMYRLSGVPGYPSDESIWYVMDEFGARIGHAPRRERRGGVAAEEEEEEDDDERPTLGMAPFFFQPEGCMYSVLWALRDMDYGDEATRDFLPHERDPYLRAGKLVAFFPNAPLPEGLSPAPLPKLAGDDAGPPPAELDRPWERPPSSPSSLPSSSGRIRVFTDLRVVHEALTDERFEPVGLDRNGGEGEAEVWWATRHIRSFEAFARERPHQLVGQLPNQKQLVCKDLLIETCGGDPEARRHLPLSYNMETSLHDFIREYRRRAAAGEDNIWIVKPWNQGRSQGVVVSDALSHILRLMETGPKVVCKYITRPITLRGFKFDLRVYLLVRQGGPEPRAYVHKRVVGRMANVPYGVGNLDDFQQHLTVFHYRAEGVETKNRLTYPEFVAAFDAEHGDGAFERARARIHTMAADVVRAACQRKDGGAMGGYQRARALLGLDVMLEPEDGVEGGMRPLLLEVTYQPDCRRILQEHPSFLNEVFQALVLDEVDEGEIVQIL